MPPTNPKAIDNSSSELTVGVSVVVPPNRTLRADKIRLKKNANIQGTTEANTYAQAKTAVIANKLTPLGAIPKLPFFLGGTPGASNATDSTTPLPAGRYNNLTVRRQKSLQLAGGFYQLNDIDLKLEASLTCQTQCVVLVKSDLVAAKKTNIEPASGNPNDFVFYVEGGNATAEPMDTAAKAVQLGGMSQVTANIYAPNGRLQFGAATLAKGAFIANHVRVEPNSIITQGPAPIGTLKLIEAGIPTTVEITGKVKLNLPACALAEDAIINIIPKTDAGANRTNAKDWHFISESAFEFLPAGQTFGCPAEIEQPYANLFANNPQFDPAKLMSFASEDDVDYQMLPGTLDPNMQTVTTKIRHFTVYLLAAPAPGNDYPKRLVKSGNYIYALQNGWSLQTYNAADPNNIQIIATQPFVWDVAPFGTEIGNGGSIYLVGGEIIVIVNIRSYSGQYYAGLLRYSLLNPAAPSLIGKVTISAPMPGIFMGSIGEIASVSIHVDGSQIYANFTGQYDGQVHFAVLNLSNPAAPSISLTDPVPVAAGGIGIRNGYAYRELYHSEIRIYDLATFSAVGTIPTPTHGRGDAMIFGVNSVIYRFRTVTNRYLVSIEDLITPRATTNQRFVDPNAYSTIPTVNYSVIFLSYDGGRILLSATGVDTLTSKAYNGIFFLQEQVGGLPTLIDRREFEIATELNGMTLQSGIYQNPWAYFPNRYPAVGNGIRAIATSPSAPTVVGTYPPGGATGVTLLSQISITFSEAMNPATLIAQTTASAGCQGSVQVSADDFASCMPLMSATPQMSSSDTVATFTPAWQGSFSTVYKIRVTTAAKNISNNPLLAYFTSAGFVMGGEIVNILGTGFTSGIQFSNITNRTMKLTWTATSLDSYGPTTGLEFKVVKDDFSAANLATEALANAKTGPDLLRDWTLNLTSATITGLTANTTYHFNILVRDAYGNIFHYTPATQATTLWMYTGNNLVVARKGHTITHLPDGRVLVAGGEGPGGTQLFASAEIFDPAANSGAGAFTPTGNMTMARVGHTATLLMDGRVLITGGYNGASVNTAEIFDPSGGGGFTSIANMTSQRFAHAASRLPDGRILICGGADSFFTILSTAEIFDPSTGTFVATNNMAGPRWGHNNTQLSDGRILITGGGDFDGNLGSAEIFTSGTETFAATANMTMPRNGHTATLLFDGRVLITGGEAASGVTASTEIFEPLGNAGFGSFTAQANMNAVRAGHSATLRSDGSVLIAGGMFDPTNPATATAEMFNPATSTFAMIGNMITPRQGHLATPLNDGRILVIGGRTYLGTPLNTAELFQ